MGPLDNAQDAEVLEALTEDIRDATMEYQVRASIHIPTPQLKYLKTALQQDIHCNNHELVVSPTLQWHTIPTDVCIGCGG